MKSSQTTLDRNFVVFTSGLFRDEQPDDEIDQWFLGEDCAQWLEAKLLSLEGVTRGVAPLEEDWHGWTFGIRAHEIWFWINIWCWEKTWVVEAEAKPGFLGFFRRDRTKLARATLCDELDSILASAPEIESRQWLEVHPADMPRIPAGTDERNVDEMIAKIEAAFAEVEHPGDDHLLHDECFDDSEIEDFYGGVGWRDVPSKIIEKNTACLASFSPQAFQYYIPAYLIWALRNYRTTDSITVDSTIFYLNAKPGDLRRFDLSKFSLLTKPQRMAITAFLEFMRDHSDGYADSEGADDALDNWWRANL